MEDNHSKVLLSNLGSNLIGLVNDFLIKKDVYGLEDMREFRQEEKELSTDGIRFTIIALEMPSKIKVPEKSKPNNEEKETIDKNSIKSEVRTLVSQNKLIDALELLSTLHVDKNVEDGIIQQLGRLNFLKIQVRNNTISEQQLSNTYDKIRLAILGLARDA